MANPFVCSGDIGVFDELPVIMNPLAVSVTMPLALVAVILPVPDVTEA